MHDGTHVREVSLSPVLVLADGQALVEAAVAGFGITQILDRVALPYVQSGKLVHLLPEADSEGPPVHAIISLGQKMAAKTRAVVNHLAETLQKTAE